MRKPDWFPGSSTEWVALLRLAGQGFPALAPMSSEERPTVQQLEEAVDCIGDELIRVGFDAPNQINSAGRMLEDLIDSLQVVIEDWEERAGRAEE
jgi:hypothetical protein